MPFHGMKPSADMEREEAVSRIRRASAQVREQQQVTMPRAQEPEARRMHRQLLQAPGYKRLGSWLRSLKTCNIVA